MEGLRIGSDSDLFFLALQMANLLGSYGNEQRQTGKKKLWSWCKALQEPSLLPIQLLQLMTLWLDNGLASDTQLHLGLK